MLFTGISCRRRGTSTIYGVMIFIGIMFTAVIPMLLVMRQADTLHDMRKFELERFNQERRDEDVHVYVFPGSEPSTRLTLKVQNRGSLVVKVVQVWINDITYLFEDFVVPPMSYLDKQLDAFDLEDNTYYFTKITTDRGNIFPSDSGSLHYLGDGHWYGGMFKINVLISYPSAGWFDVEIKQGSDEGPHIAGSPFVIHKTSSGPVFEFYTVLDPDIYHVKITRKDMDVIYDKPVTIDWPYGPPVAWVFA